MSTAAIAGENHGSTIEFEDSGIFRDNWYPQRETRGNGRAAAASLPGMQEDLSGGIPGIAYEACKRVMDVVVSLTALILLSPVLILAAVMIKLHDGGPVFFTQDRVGRDGRRFRMFKFRSMILQAEALKSSLVAKNEHADPRTFKISDDPRITPPGRVLRRFSIDELPQIFNVMFGDMSIVGPRPPVPSEVALYSDSDFRRLAVKPGLTCIWQVSGRSRLAFPEQVKMDVEYIERRNLLLDLSLIVRTVPAVLSGDGAV
jgi:lipopolysaccharide/colanic/teichoic acid biosynthesis glycosyltransferase